MPQPLRSVDHKEMAKRVQSQISSSLADLKSDEPIICNVCLSVYDEGPRLPLTLACHHSFCAACIADSLLTPEDRNKVFCPLCKTKTILDRRGIAGLPINEQSLEFVRNLEIRKQMELMEQQREMDQRFDPSMPPYPDVPSRVAYPLWAAKPSEPGQPKGILKNNPKQQRHVRMGTRPVGQPGLNNGAPKRSNGAAMVCSQCEAERAEKQEGASVAQQHAVIVRSVDRLHPPPNSFFSNETKQPHPATETSDQERHLTNGSDDMEGERMEEAGSTTYPFLPDLSADDNQQLSADLLSCRRNEDNIPGFLRPLSQNNDPTSITPDTTPGPIRGKNDLDPLPNGRIYPVNALLYMASAEGIPRDQIGSAGPEVTSSDPVLPPLTESQQVLPPSAKYVGRFGKYSDRRQPGSFSAPHRIVCSSDGARLAVSDLAGSVVHLFSSRGEFIVTFSTPETTGGVCFFTDGDLAVTTAKGVQVHAPNGIQKKVIPIVGVFAVAAFKQGFVTATRNRISVCRSLLGSVVHSINGKRDQGLLQKQTPFEEVTDIAVGPKDELCILESKVVLVMNEEGVVATVIHPTLESVCGPLGKAVALAVCPDDGSFVVADAGHRRVLLFGADGQFLRCLVKVEDSVQAGWSISGVAVTKSKKMFVVAKTKQMAEVRVYAILAPQPS